MRQIFKFKRFSLIALLLPLFLLAEEEVVKPVEDHYLNYIFDTYPSTYYPASVHWLLARSGFGDSIELEDRSIWKISGYDQYKINNWLSNDPLVITQNHRWFSKFHYRIINTKTGISVETDLHFGPLKNGDYTTQITAIDRDRYELRAVNGLGEVTHWEICSRDWPDFDEWRLNDAIIVGYNSGWDSSYESILINVNMNNFVRAKQF